MTKHEAHEVGDGRAAVRIAFRPHSNLPWLLAPQGVALQILIDATPARIPNTRTWFRGMINQRGNLLPVFDLSAWAGIPADDGKQSQIVAVDLGEIACAVVCDSAPTLIVPGNEIPATKEVNALSEFLGRSYVGAHGSVREFDLRRWLTKAAQQISGIAPG